MSGTQAYRDGEWMYQDYLYDDHGAAGTPDPDPALVGFTIALGDSSQPHAWPAQANVTSPAAYFVTVHGGSAPMTRAGSGKVAVHVKSNGPIRVVLAGCDRTVSNR